MLAAHDVSLTNKALMRSATSAVSPRYFVEMPRYFLHKKFLGAAKLQLDVHVHG